MEKLLTPADVKSIKSLLEQQPAHRAANAIKRAYYHAKVQVNSLGNVVPVQYLGLKQAVAACQIAISAINARMDFEGWYEEAEGTFGLQKIYDDSYVDDVAPKAHQDMLVYGMGFVVVSSGDTVEGEPEVLISAEHPDNVEVEMNPRSGRAIRGIIVTDEDGNDKYLTYVTREMTVPCRIINGEVVELEGGFFHGLGRCPIIPFVNRPESNRTSGHSEITEPMMTATQNMMRALLYMSVAAEYHSTPQKYILGATQEMFEGKEGEATKKLSVLMNKVLILEDDEWDNGSLSEQGGSLQRSRVSVGQFSTNDPSIYTTMLTQYAKDFAAMAFIPQDYLGLTTVNPTSADQTRAAEGRLIDKTKGIMRGLKKPWAEVAELAVLTRDGELPEDWSRPMVRFRDLSTPARSATADEIGKLISAEVVGPTSEIVYNRLDLSPEEREILKAENAMKGAQSILDALAGAVAADGDAVPVAPVAEAEKPELVAA